MIRAALLCIFCAGPAVAQDAAGDAAAALSAAAAQLEAAESAEDRAAALTETLRAYEAGLSAMRLRQRSLTLQEGEIAATLIARREELARLVGVLSAIGRTPEPVRQAHPAGPLANLRAGMLVADLTPAIEAEVAELRTLLARATELRQAQDTAAAQLQAGLEGAQAARAALTRAMADRSDLPSRFADDPVQTALMVANAETLDAFATDIAAARPDSDESLAANGDLPLPVAGVVLPDDASGRPGLRIAAAPRALVTSPAAATVLFQGPLLDYGTVVILEPAVDVMFILAGLEEVFVEPGDVLPAGAPVGLLGAGDPADDGILTENLALSAGQAAAPLYLEVREGQSAVNPGDWFTLQDR